MRLRPLLVLSALLSVACDRESETAEADAYRTVLPFDTARMRIATAADTLTLTVQLAETEEQRALGLMERRALADTAGMLFVYSTTQPESAGFWMYRTRIPLDIAFIDSAGVIRSIRTMQPCPTELAQACPTYEPGVRYRAALEVNAGFFERRAVRVGDRVVLEDTTTRRRASAGR